MTREVQYLELLFQKPHRTATIYLRHSGGSLLGQSDAEGIQFGCKGQVMLVVMVLCSLSHFKEVVDDRNVGTLLRALREASFTLSMFSLGWNVKSFSKSHSSLLRQAGGWGEWV